MFALSLWERVPEGRVRGVPRKYMAAIGNALTPAPLPEGEGRMDAPKRGKGRTDNQLKEMEI